MLRLSGVSKNYGGNPALEWAADASLEINAGEIHGVVGENGAGKSTLFGIVAGLLAPSGGSLELDGEPYAPRSVAAARACGVEIVTQEQGLLGSLTVAENFDLGRKRRGALQSSVFARGRTHEVRRALAPIAPDVSPRSLAGSLSLDQQKLVELARAVHFVDRVLLIDEMSAVLDHEKLGILFDALRAQREAGKAILYISHYLEEVADLCDRVTVLRDGQLVQTLPIADATEERLSELMVGRAVTSEMYPARTARDRSQSLLTGVGLTVDGEFQDVDLEVARGEILGIGGLIGCGSDALARTLFGEGRLTAGEMTLAGEPYSPRGPRSAIARRVAYVPPDRDHEGLLLRASIAANVTLAALPELARAGVYYGQGEGRRTTDVIKRLMIRCHGSNDMPLNLSGGNRQKVVLAKWLVTPVEVFILHNPTRGVDIGAKSEIYAVIRQLADQGAAVVLVSDELPELLGMSDRIMVLRRGRVSKLVGSGDSPTEHSLIRFMV